MNISRHIEAAKMVAANPDAFPASIVDLARRVLVQHVRPK